MMYSVAVCDDDAACRTQIRDLTQIWADRAGVPVHIREFPSAESFLFAYEEDKAYDILLLDIEMEAVSGVALAKQVRAENETAEIIFVTGYTDYIAEGYDVAALQYLVKPVREEKFFATLDRARDRLKKNESRLMLETGDGIVLLPLHKIRYLDVRQNYVTLHAERDYTVKKPLGELAQQLDERFYRVGRSAIVSLPHIAQVTKSDIFLTDGTAVPLPRGAYDGIMRAIIQMK